MTKREQIEQQIRELLATESQALLLSDKLFSPSGLFSQLASTEQERRTIARSTLFKEAQWRLTALQQAEAATFSRVVRQVQDSSPDGSVRFKIEQAGTG
jgi:hypothetical protein